MRPATSTARGILQSFHRRAAAPLLIALLICGCETELETGYKYRPLGDSAVQRRAYYASPFSVEKAAADQERQQNKQPASPGAQSP